MNRIAASTLPYLALPLSEALQRIEGLGIAGVEVYYEGKHSLPQHSLRDALSVHDFDIFLHAPFSDLNLATFNKSVMKESKKQIKGALEVAAGVGVQATTVHFGRFSPLGLSYPEEAVKRNLESVKEISDFAGTLGVEIAFENSPKGFGVMCGSLDVLKGLVKETGVRITLDIGHANTWGKDVTDFINGLNSSIFHVHLHDNTGEGDMHLAVGEGVIDFERVFAAFREINYKNTLCLEMLYERDLEKSLSIIGTFLD